MAKALDDAAQALVTEARGNNKLATLSPVLRTRRRERRDVREDLHQRLRRARRSGAP